MGKRLLPWEGGLAPSTHRPTSRDLALTVNTASWTKGRPSGPGLAQGHATSKEVPGCTYGLSTEFSAHCHSHTRLGAVYKRLPLTGMKHIQSHFPFGGNLLQVYLVKGSCLPPPVAGQPPVAGPQSSVCTPGEETANQRAVLIKIKRKKT